jgi:hypothetical protein
MSDVPASVATTTSVASAVFAWIAQANEIAALVASLVAIVAGCYAILHYRSHRKP